MSPSVSSYGNPPAGDKTLIRHFINLSKVNNGKYHDPVDAHKKLKRSLGRNFFICDKGNADFW